MGISLEPPYLIIKPGMTEAQFYQMADEDSDWEYIAGRIVMHSPASDRHENVFRFLLTLFSNFLDERGGAVVSGSRYPMRLDAQWSPEPDILVVRDSRTDLMSPQRLEGPADMVIEIVSESDPGFDYREKHPRYREARIEEIWIVNPFNQTVFVDKLGVGGYVSKELSSGKLDSQVISGFWIDVFWLRQEKLPSTLRCIREILG